MLQICFPTFKLCLIVRKGKGALSITRKPMMCNCRETLRHYRDDVLRTCHKALFLPSLSADLKKNAIRRKKKLTCLPDISACRMP